MKVGFLSYKKIADDDSNLILCNNWIMHFLEKNPFFNHVCALLFIYEHSCVLASLPTIVSDFKTPPLLGIVSSFCIPFSGGNIWYYSTKLIAKTLTFFQVRPNFCIFLYNWVACFGIYVSLQNVSTEPSKVTHFSFSLLGRLIFFSPIY